MPGKHVRLEPLSLSHAREAFAQIEVATGRVVGTTSFYEVVPERRRLVIGYTIVGSEWHGTAINPEAKLLLLSEAFDVRGALRVAWYTDVQNVRSQRAIEKLGAARDGVLRANGSSAVFRATRVSEREDQLGTRRRDVLGDLDLHGDLDRSSSGDLHDVGERHDGQHAGGAPLYALLGGVEGLTGNRGQALDDDGDGVRVGQPNLALTLGTRCEFHGRAGDVVDFKRLELLHARLAAAHGVRHRRPLRVRPREVHGRHDGRADHEDRQRHGDLKARTQTTHGATLQSCCSRRWVRL
jgi:RimJ/RimL family protein N-acetyltransferase